MKTYKIPVSWEVYSELEIEAESLEEAIKLAEDADLPPTDKQHYVDSSWVVDSDLAKDMNP